MTEVHFYHLTRNNVEEVLPALLEKTRERGWKAVVMASSPERVESLNRHLWVSGRDSFLPHGSARDGEAALQPIWLTESDERPNGAQVLFLTDGAVSQQQGDYERVCDIFDGENEEAVAAARQRWQECKEKGFTLSYWQQGDNGWAKQAAA
ncbi:MAG: DNA polymerase III subunit chi [Alphaproteobacteria bacterium]|nr:DNA polymerase III subunit chi [Alphaproteobacteria bacterium]